MQTLERFIALGQQGFVDADRIASQKCEKVWVNVVDRFTTVCWEYDLEQLRNSGGRFPLQKWDDG